MNSHWSAVIRSNGSRLNVALLGAKIRICRNHIRGGSGVGCRPTAYRLHTVDTQAL